MSTRVNGGPKEQHVLCEGGVEQTHGAHPSPGIYKHPLQVLVRQDVTRVAFPQLHHYFREGLLVILTYSITHTHTSTANASETEVRDRSRINNKLLVKLKRLAMTDFPNDRANVLLKKKKKKLYFCTRNTMT